MENELVEERIDRYILGQMSDEEKAIFEKEIEKDERLKERLHLQQAIPSAIQKAHLKHLFEVADEQIESENTELADNYILGRLSKEQCSDFEKKLNEDASLKETYERQKNVVSAVQKAHLKNIFEKCDENVDDSIDAIDNEGTAKVIPITTPNTATTAAANKTPLRIFITYAIAACFALMLLVSPRVFYSSSMIEYGENIRMGTRSASDSLYSKCSELIDKGDYDKAEMLLNEKEETSKECLYDAEWYRCVIHIKKGHVYRAWWGLRKISKSDSPHKDEAQIYLDKIFK